MENPYRYIQYKFDLPLTFDGIKSPYSIFKERSSFYDSVLSFRPTVRPWENNASSSKTIRDN